MQAVTDFADLALLLPLILLVGLSLAMAGVRRDVLAWLAAVAFALGGILLLKLLVLSFPGLAAAIGQPSGHTAAGIVTYAGLATLLGGSRAARWAIALLAAGACWLLFGWSRLALGVHAPRDVLVGGVIGMLGILALLFLAGRQVARPRGRALACTAALAVMAVLLLHGTRLHAERHLRLLVQEIRAQP